MLRDVPRWNIRPVADCYEQIAVGRDRDAASRLPAQPFGRDRRLRPEDDLDFAQRGSGLVQFSPHHIGVAVRSVDEIVEGEENLVIRREMRIEYDIQKADILRAGGSQLRDPRHRLGKCALRVQNPYAAW